MAENDTVLTKAQSALGAMEISRTNVRTALLAISVAREAGNVEAQQAARVTLGDAIKVRREAGGEWLAALEAPRILVESAQQNFYDAKNKGDTKLIEAAELALAAAITTRTAAKITQLDIEEAAQAHLDHRGEAHTELNILEPGTTHPIAAAAPKVES